MADDWGIGASAPSFSLFKSSTPEEEAEKDTFVDIIVYNRWKKSERRLYQRLKSERIAKQLETEKLQSIDDLTNALNSLTMFKTVAKEIHDPLIDDLIGRVNHMKIQAQNNRDDTKDRHRR